MSGQGWISSVNIETKTLPAAIVPYFGETDQDIEPRALWYFPPQRLNKTLYLNCFQRYRSRIQHTLLRRKRREMPDHNHAPALPVFVKAAGHQATESYMSFLGQQSSCASNYRSLSRRFFGWAEQHNLALEKIRREHVAQFHHHLLEEAGPNLAASSFSVISRLFRHMHEAGGLPANPAEGLAATRQVPAKRMKKALSELMEADDDHEQVQAALVMLAPVCIGSFSLKAIRAWSQLPFPTVERLAGRLYQTGIWGEGMTIRCEWLDPECEHPDFAILMDSWVIMGDFERDEEMRYRLPPEKYERLKAAGETKEKRVEVTRNVREERREIVTVIEASERIVVDGE